MEIHTLALLAQATSQRNPLIGVLPFVIMFLLFWMMIIVPQRRQAKAHLAMVQALAKGDQVVTAGGLIGTITAVRDDSIELRTGSSTVVVERARVTRKVDAAGGPAKAG